MDYEHREDKVEIIVDSNEDFFDRVETRLKDNSLKGIIYKFLFVVPGLFISTVALVILVSLLIAVIAAITIAAVVLVGSVFAIYFIILWLIQPIAFFSEVFKKLARME